MTIEWTTDQVLALAPDGGSAQSGKGLAVPRLWETLGRREEALWGEFLGSGAKPYQTRIDLAEPAFKCTCPSRKFPCKHALGLFLLYAKDCSALPDGEPPGWVAEWLEARAGRAQKKAVRAAEGDKPPDPEQQARRAEARQGRVDKGVEELELWLRDLVRHGLAWAQTQPVSFWTGIAARMVDAQAPGLARLVRELALAPAGGEGWHGRLLTRLARLHLLLQGWRRLEALEPLVREDVRAAIGFTTAREAVLAQGEVSDTWLVAAQEVELGEDNIRTQRLWLWGRATRRPALILSFAHAMAPAFEITLPPGAVFEGTLAYYPSAAPLRALVKACRQLPWDHEGWAGDATIGVALEAYAGVLERNPWAERVPLALGGVRPVRSGEAWQLCDGEGALLPTRLETQTGWIMTAVCGAGSATVFGEWDGERLTVQAMIAEGRFYVLRGVERLGTG